MDRRQILKYTAYITGAAVSAPLAASLLSGCQPEKSASSISDSGIFTKDDMTLLKEVIDTILPKTDSPSATEVGVHDIIRHMVSDVYNEDQKNNYYKGFNALSSYLNSAEDVNDGINSLESSGGSSATEAKEAYKALKQQTVAYYLSTEEIATNYLNYLPVPGVYEPCITVEEAGGKLWAI